MMTNRPRAERYTTVQAFIYTRGIIHTLLQPHLIWEEFGICTLAAIANHYNLAVLFHQVPTTDGWAEVA